MIESIDQWRLRIIKLARKDVDQADFELNRMANEYGRSALFWDARSHVHILMRKYDLAIADIDMAISLQTNEPANYFHKGELLCGIGRFQEAIDSFSEAIEFGELAECSYYDEMCRFFRAFCNCKLGNFSVAESDLEKISDENPIWIDRLRSRAELLEVCKVRKPF